MKLTQEEAIKFTQCIQDGISFNEGIWVMEFYNKTTDIKYQTQELGNIKLKIFRDFEKEKAVKKTGSVDKKKFKECVSVECFNKDGFLKFAEMDGKDIPLTRTDIKQNEWNKIKNNVIKQENNSHNL